MSDAREKILGRVNAALAPLKTRVALPDWDRALIDLRSNQVGTDLWELFSERTRAVNGVALSGIDALVALLKTKQWLHGYCDPALWPTLQSTSWSGVTVETHFDRARVDEYQFGITLATGAIAETGTLILSDRVTSSRLAALAPWAHVGVLKRAQIYPDITAAVAALPEDPNTIWATGPSKTADVEGILIEGVHGPGVQIAFLLE